MFVTDKFAIRFMPKTASTWVRRVCAMAFPAGVDLGHQHQITPLDRPIFAFVRNPWAWYVSLYHFNKYGGSDIYQKPIDNTALRGQAFLIAPVDEWEFDEWIVKYSTTDRAKKKEIADKYILTLLANSILATHSLANWCKNDLSYYESAVEMYGRNVTGYGTAETVKTDLTRMLDSVGCLTDEAKQAMELPKVNLGLAGKPYQEFYTPATRDLVGETNRNIITKYGYTFE